MKLVTASTFPATMMLIAVCVAGAAAHKRAASQEPPETHKSPPDWAYVGNPSASKSGASNESGDAVPRHVPNSAVAFTLAQIRDLFNVPDWHPDGHPEIPEIVAHGRKPEVFACGYCHLPNGQGRPENSSLAGLPVEYTIQQMAEFKGGLRKSSEPSHLPAAMMATRETKATEQEIQIAAQYFSALKPKQWIRVVEASDVPKTNAAGWMLVASEPPEMERIGQRIIEMPENLERTELRDDTSGFVAYVPVGSIEKGKALVTTGGAGKTTACTLCHGTDLKGKDTVPPLAGRSPSYVVRQLYDMQSGARAGAAANLMKPAVAKLTIEDMISIAAYVSSLHP